MTLFRDVFVSYGRADSREFAADLTQQLIEAGLRVWFDFEDIPLGVDYQKQIDDGIDKADNFLFIISPHAVNSAYCELETTLALNRNKRIIPIMHVEEISRDTWQARHPQGTDADWAAYQAAGRHSSYPNMNPVVNRINWVCFRDGIDDFEESLQDLLVLFERDRDYVHQHTVLLDQALTWERNHRQPHDLLVDTALTEAEAWLQKDFSDRQPPCLPTQLHCQFISESLKNAQGGLTDVFLCHAEEDRDAFDAIYALLTREGFTVWTNWYDIQMGMDFKEAINRGIESANNIVYLLSPAAQRSSWCQHEVDYALSLNKRILPILLHPVDLQATLPEIASLQFVDLTGDPYSQAYHAQERNLLKALKQNADYYQAHKHLLVKALKWERQLRNPCVLLQGHTLRQTAAWLKVAQQQGQYPPLPVQVEFVEASLRQPPNTKLDVFIACDARDLEFARKLNETLQVQGERTWFESDRTALGADHDAQVKDGIARADNCVFLISQEALQNAELLAEIRYATSLSKRSIAIAYRNCDEISLPQDVGPLPWVDFTAYNGDFLTNFGVLYRIIDSHPEHVQGHTRLLNRALEWHQSGNDDSVLLHGKALANAQQWYAQAHDKIPKPSELQRSFLEASQNLSRRRTKPRSLVSLSLGMTLLVLIARFTGLLQGLELFAYDYLLRQRANEPQDDRFLMVTVDDSSGSYLRDRIINGQYEAGIGTIPDDALNEALTILTNNDARLIGLDFYRDFPANDALAPTLRNSDRLITLCKQQSSEAEGIIKAPEVEIEQVGFGDFLGDRQDGADYLRRHYLMDGADPDYCDTPYAFNLRIVQRYLEQEGIPFTSPAKPGGGFRGNGLKLGELTVPNLFVTRGPYYQEEQLQGYQTLLNFRTAPNPDGKNRKDPLQFAPQVKLAALLAGEVPAELIRDRIVLIGYTDYADRNADYWETPYGPMPGVFLQGQMASQLINAALNERSLIRWWPIGIELIWILGWSLAGGLIVRQVVYLPRLSAMLAIGVVVLYGSCFVAMVFYALWIPFFPPLFAFMLTAGSVAVLNYRLRHP